jgi:predicted nucleic acid-binding protein
MAPILSRLGLTFHVDTNFVGDESPAAAELRALDADKWIKLQRADALETELLRDEDEERRERLRDEASKYPQVAGPFILNESLLDFGLLASDEDEVRFGDVFDVLFPGTDRCSETSRTASNKRRDAMHISTAIRYGISVFITRDDALLAKAPAIAAKYNGFSIMDPEPALAFANRMRERFEAHTSAPE